MSDFMIENSKIYSKNRFKDKTYGLNALLVP
jgi:hypothetical protein